MARTLGKILAHSGASPPPGFFASPTGSATGAGTFESPWTLAQACLGGYPVGTLNGTAGKNVVWLRGGTYVGRFSCGLSGTAAYPITFKNFPGERAIIDSQAAPSTNEDPVLKMNGSSTDLGYQIWQGLEILNSNTDRSCNPGMTNERGNAVTLSMSNSKLVNCILHDAGQGLATSNDRPNKEIYGCLVYHNGYDRYMGESGDHGAAVDLVDNGTAVALSGTAYSGSTTAGTSITFAATATGNYMVVVAHTYDTVAPDYTAMTATCNGAAMTRIGGKNSADPQGPRGCIGIFGIASPTTGNVVVSYPESHAMSAIAQCFSNVASATQEGDWDSGILVIPPFTASATSAASHMVVDCGYFYGIYGTNYAPSGDNLGKQIATRLEAGSAFIGMSYATGAASVSMSWDWDPNIDVHGHGMYVHSGDIREDIVTINGDNTITSASNPWIAADVGKPIIVRNGVGGTELLITTISAFNSAGSIELTVAPTASITTKANWGEGDIIEDNIVYDQIGDNCIQATGTAGADFCWSEVTGNLWVYNGVYLTQSTGFYMTGTNWHHNYSWSQGTSWGATSNLQDFLFNNNYVHDLMGDPPVTNATITNNTFIAPMSGAFQAAFPTNDYSYIATPPTTNSIVVRANTYEANRANIYVYNWQALATVNVDISSAIAVGTPIYVMHAQNYFGTPVWTGIYSGGTITLPMDAATLTVQAGIGTLVNGTPYTPQPTTAPAFAAFIVRAQAEEAWR